MPDLFSSTKTSEFEQIDLPGADVQFKPDFLARQRAEMAFENLLLNTEWEAQKVFVWGKWHDQPRLVAWHGDEGATYSYSGSTLTPKPWSPVLLLLKREVEEAANAKFNSVLLNLYRDQNDSMGWHSDNETALGRRPVIASLSLGETREFLFKHRTEKQQRIRRVPLTSGSLLVMRGDTQINWLHAINRERSKAGNRVNLTFRLIQTS